MELVNKVMIKKSFQAIEVETRNSDLIKWLMKNSIHRDGEYIFKIEPYKLRDLLDIARNLNMDIISSFPLINRIKLGKKKELVLRDYQEKAIEWLRMNNYRGIIILPTGAGKSYIGIELIRVLKVKTLIVVPTIDLLSQWEGKIISELGVSEESVGVYGGDRREIRDITIITYQSASKVEFLQRNMTNFSLLILDEVHHVTGEKFIEIPKRFVAPYRIGLTATLDIAGEKREMLEEIIGKIIQLSEIDQLITGGYLANYDYELIRVNLTTAEEAKYRALIRTYSEYLKLEGIRERGNKAYFEVLSRAKGDEYARRALRALREARELAYFNKSKLIKLNELLLRHRKEKIIIFSRHTRTASIISYIFIINLKF